MKIYKCDGQNCASKNNNPKASGWLTVGSTNGQNLTIVNDLPTNSEVKFHAYHDMHFCSKECFNSRIFKPKS